MNEDRQDIEFDAEGGRCAAGSTRRPVTGGPPLRGHGARLGVDEGDVPRRLRGGVRRGGPGGRGVRLPGFGASDAASGKPRHEIDPWEQIRDYQHAITYASNRPDVDAAASACGERATPPRTRSWSRRRTGASRRSSGRPR
ncbi:hypothetical protein ACFQX6_56925 [Streptosporangium lutulentum]